MVCFNPPLLILTLLWFGLFLGTPVTHVTVLVASVYQQSNRSHDFSMFAFTACAEWGGAFTLSLVTRATRHVDLTKTLKKASALQSPLT